MQEYVARRMNAIYYMKTWKNLKAPIIPFGYKNIHSDDDLITGSGKAGKMMEDLYVEALDQHIKEHAMRPMTEMDRHRVDVNGLAWNMTQEGALENFWHKENFENAVAEAKGRMDSLLSFQINDEAIEKIRKLAGEARASYEAAQLFDDAVREAARNSEACAREAEKLYAQKTSPEAQVSQHDCSACPGTAAKWDSAKKAPKCECAPGNLWEENLFTCVSEEQYYVIRLDCSPYPNAHPGWDAGRRKASCYCNDGYEWNNARTHCRVNAQTQVAQADCSNLPGTRAGWDSAQERVWCYCPQGYSLEGSRREIRAKAIFI